MGMVKKGIKILSQLFNSAAESLVWNGWYRNKYSSQVKAMRNPYSTCFSHCVCWLLQNHSDRFKTLLPDDVTKEINSSKYREWTRRHLGATVLNRFSGKLNQLWEVQRRYAQDKLDEAGIKKVANFRRVEKGNTDLLKTIIRVSPICVSTAPSFNNRRLGHIMLMVDHKVTSEGEHWVVDDPFGDFRVNYTTGHVNTGNDLVVSLKSFEKIRTGYVLYIG